MNTVSHRLVGPTSQGFALFVYRDAEELGHNRANGCGTSSAIIGDDEKGIMEVDFAVLRLKAICRCED